MVPNQYWTPGALAPMPMMGKYYMFYGPEFFPPRTLGRVCAERMMAELAIDDLGVCRFHRGWAEEMLPEIVGSVYGMKDEYLKAIAVTASRINSRNASVFWESERDLDFVASYLSRRRDVERTPTPSSPDGRGVREGPARGGPVVLVRDAEGDRREPPGLPLSLARTRAGLPRPSRSSYASDQGRRTRDPSAGPPAESRAGRPHEDPQ